MITIYLVGVIVSFILSCFWIENSDTPTWMFICALLVLSIFSWFMVLPLIMAKLGF